MGKSYTKLIKTLNPHMYWDQHISSMIIKLLKTIVRGEKLSTKRKKDTLNIGDKDESVSSQTVQARRQCIEIFSSAGEKQNNNN